MCTQDQLRKITNEVSDGVQKALGNRLHNIILYGSYARGDYNEDSDIDIMVLADVNNEELSELRKSIYRISNDISLEYNILLSIFLKDKGFFDEHVSILPFYQNVIKDGVMIYG